MTPSQRTEAEGLARKWKSLGYPAVPTFGEWLYEVSPDWRWDWPHLVLARYHLMRVARGECKRLMIFMPPRHGKSEMTTIRFPVWLMEQDPTFRVIVAAYNSDLATYFSTSARDIAIQRRIPFGKRFRSEDWQTSQSGGLRAVGVGKGATGRGADLIVVDDPVKDAAEADSLAYQRSVWEWYTKVIRTRLEPDGAIILIMTRWNESDLAGKLLDAADKGGEHWDVVSMTALADQDEEYDLGNGRAWRRNAGEALCPDRYNEAELAQTRDAIGPRAWEALYQQRPRPIEGAIFKRDWFQVIDRAPADVRWARYHDLAVSTRTSADFTASIAVGLDTQGNVYLRDLFHEQLEWPDARKRIVDIIQAEKHLRVIQAIEKALHGSAAVQELGRDPDVRGAILRGVDVYHDKVVRALAWQAKAELGKVYLCTEPTVPHVRPNWPEIFFAEVCSFPVAKHDDIVDTVSGGYLQLTEGAIAGALGIVQSTSAKGWFATSSDPPSTEPLLRVHRAASRGR